jgi:hypothetical protein
MIRQVLKGHAFHAKRDDELRYIIKDAGEAARAMQGFDPVAEGKYLDQVSDACTILNHRARYGSRVPRGRRAA